MKLHIDSAKAQLSGLSRLAEGFFDKYGHLPPPDPNVIKKEAERIGASGILAENVWTLAKMVGESRSLSNLYNGLLDVNLMNEYHESVSGLMQALVLFGMLPGIWARHKQLNIPEEITCDTLQDYFIALDVYASLNDGAFGMDYFKWLVNHVDCKLFKIGRLQYILKPYNGYARVFVCDTTGEIIMSAQSGIVFRGDGLIDGGNELGQNKPCESYWESKTYETNDTVESNCLLVDGRAIQAKISLDKKIWRLALDKDIYGLEMHIPRGRPLYRNECIESLREAWRFYRAYFPDKAFEAFYCGSWLLDANIKHILPPASGIVQFLSLYRLYPLPGTPWSFVDRAFDTDPTTITDIMAFARTADRGTGLRRAVADYILAGGSLSSAGGVIHQYDLMKFT